VTRRLRRLLAHLLYHSGCDHGAYPCRYFDRLDRLDGKDV
jgi:hypothetical protein